MRVEMACAIASTPADVVVGTVEDEHASKATFTGAIRKLYLRLALVASLIQFIGNTVTVISATLFMTGDHINSTTHHDPVWKILFGLLLILVYLVGIPWVLISSLLKLNRREYLPSKFSAVSFKRFGSLLIIVGGSGVLFSILDTDWSQPSAFESHVNWIAIVFSYAVHIVAPPNASPTDIAIRIVDLVANVLLVWVGNKITDAGLFDGLPKL